MIFMTNEKFIQQIATSVIKYAPKYGIMVASPIIAQACLESSYGKSEKAKHHNYFGLKYRKNRVSCNNGYFSDSSLEQKNDGSYIPINTDWYSFNSMDSGIEGYFQFINTSKYSNLKGVADPKIYLELIKKDGYATSLEYVQNVYSVILKWNLEKYDNQINKEASAMKYTNSPLVDCTVLSPNHSGERTHKIDRITPHCVVGQLSAKSIGNCFPKGREASCNYGIGYDGKRCLIVEEKNRSWCTSSSENDQRAITIEVASDKTHPYTFTNEAYKSLIELCIDICRRNNITKVLWFGDKTKSLKYVPKDGECVFTVHRWFDNKNCPGDWMYSHMDDLTNKINETLNVTNNVTEDDLIIKKPNGSTFLYRVQCGAYKNKTNAAMRLRLIKEKGVDAFIVEVDGLYKVQVGAYSIKTNAEKQLNKMKALGFDCFITKVERASESFTPRIY